MSDRLNESTIYQVAVHEPIKTGMKIAVGFLIVSAIVWGIVMASVAMIAGVT